jgi:Na+-driven multidrug efflux pump
MIGLNNIMRATGYPRKAMLSSMLTVGCNIILAPVFIFWLGWGIRGAATATILSQFAGMIWVLSHFMQEKSYIRFKKGIFKLRKRIVENIFSIGMSPFLMNVCASAIVIIFNKSLLLYGGDLAIGAYGILNRLLMLFVMVIMGLTMGMQPIVGYNHGAHKFGRVKQTLKYCMIAGGCITSLGFAFSELFPNLVVNMFTDDKELTALARTGLQYRSTDVSFRGNTNCNFQFLPIYRESENFYLPLLVPPTVVFITLPAITTSLVGTERYLAQYACIRSVSVYHSLPDAGTSY